MKFRHKLITFVMLCLYGCSPHNAGEVVKSSNGLNVEIIMADNDIPLGVSRFKISEGWIYTFKGHRKGGITFVPDQDKK